MKDPCNRYRRLISLDMDGELDEAGRTLLEEHLTACPRCAGEKALWHRIRGLIPDPRAATSDGLALRVVDRIRRRRLEQERVLPLMRRTAAAAAILIFATLATLLALPERRPAAPLAPRASRDLGNALIQDHAHGPALHLGSAPDDQGDAR